MEEDGVEDGVEEDGAGEDIGIGVFPAEEQSPYHVSFIPTALRRSGQVDSTSCTQQCTHEVSIPVAGDDLHQDEFYY